MFLLQSDPPLVHLEHVHSGTLSSVHFRPLHITYDYLVMSWYLTPWKLDYAMCMFSVSHCAIILQRCSTFSTLTSHRGEQRELVQTTKSLSSYKDKMCNFMNKSLWESVQVLITHCYDLRVQFHPEWTHKDSSKHVQMTPTLWFALIGLMNTILLWMNTSSNKTWPFFCQWVKLEAARSCWNTRLLVDEKLLAAVR